MILSKNLESTQNYLHHSSSELDSGVRVVFTGVNFATPGDSAGIITLTVVVVDLMLVVSLLFGCNTGLRTGFRIFVGKSPLSRMRLLSEGAIHLLLLEPIFLHQEGPDSQELLLP